MNIEEAKANIGKEVVLDESTKPYTSSISDSCPIPDKIMDQINKSNLYIQDVDDELLDVGVAFTKCGDYFFVYPCHIKLKEQPMNYKIKVTPETSAEVQELFFELGFKWRVFENSIIPHSQPLMYNKFGYLYAGCIEGNEASENKEITLPQLRDMVVLKRNDVNDATHGAHFSYDRFYISENCCKEYLNDKWVDKTSHAMPIPLSKIKEPFIQVVGRGSKQMTWKDALVAVSDGEEVEMKNRNDEWESIDEFQFRRIRNNESKFRLKPKTIHVDCGDYTKEELLKIAGEMV